MPENVQLLKTTRREATLAARRRRTSAERSAAGAAIAALGVAAWASASSVAAYLSIGDEPPTRVLIDGLVGRGVRVLLPVIDDGQLDWAVYSGPRDLTSGPLGITEPTGTRLGANAVESVDVVILPALAVDRDGNRLGRGRGYYDRALAGVTAPIVAVVYDDEFGDHVPTEAHDRRVDAVLCPAALIKTPSAPTSRP